MALPADWGNGPMNSERLTIHIEILDFTDLEEFELTLPEFIQFLSDEIEAKVPEEFHGSVRIHSKVECGECDDHTIITASYTRPETDREFHERIAASESYSARAEYDRDFARYNQLKSKYGW